MQSLYPTIVVLKELLAETEALEEGTQDGGYIIEVEELIKRKIDTLTREEIIRLEAESKLLNFKANMAKYDIKMINRGNCMFCGKPLTEDEGLFFCKECEKKGRNKDG